MCKQNLTLNIQSNMSKISNEEILKRENSNTAFNEIHLYLEPKFGVWVAYGPSAFALRNETKSKKGYLGKAYSRALGVPCAIANREGVLALRAELAVVEETDSYLHVLLREPMSSSDYIKWDTKIKEVELSEKYMDISTKVSHLVPKDRFIPDGMSSFARYFKRASDFVLSAIALIIFSPLTLLCYILVKCGDGGPAIYKQERIGRFGRPFYIYKFRSMRLDAEKMGPQLSHSGGEDDPRLTKVGKFIRAHHLDELPQLYNVFCGDMSFVGPRPERKFYIDQILEYDKRYSYLYQIRPGVTSYATLHNGYTDTMEKMLQRLEYVLFYLGHRSAWFDFKILFQTFCRIVFGKVF